VFEGGTNHINEQPHTYWEKLFAEYFFCPFDLFRPVFWGDEDVDFWYRQNVFLYARKDSSEWHLMASSGQKPMAKHRFHELNPSRRDAFQFQASPRGAISHLCSRTAQTLIPHERTLIGKLQRSSAL
jgi:hypothetical protein